MTAWDEGRSEVMRMGCYCVSFDGGFGFLAVDGVL